MKSVLVATLTAESIAFCGWQHWRGISRGSSFFTLSLLKTFATGVVIAVRATSIMQESIAFYGGEHRESAIAGSRLASLVGTTRRKLAWEAGLSLWTNAYT